jgi:hypothetical protein
MSMTDGHWLDLDRRLTRLEQLIQSGLAEITRRLDQINGRVTENDRWRLGHEQHHAEIQARQARLEASDAWRERETAAQRWRWGAAIALGTTVANVIVQIVLRWLGR